MNKKMFLLPLLLVGLAACGGNESAGGGNNGGNNGADNNDPVVCDLTGGAMPAGWTYITNNPQYPDAGWYAGDNPGLKLNFEGMGVTSPDFATKKDPVVTLNINALNQNTKTGTSTDVFTVYAYNASGEQVTTAAIQTIAVGENVINVTGSGITKIDVKMTGYYMVDGKGNNVNLGSVTVA